ncbi:MAG: hypothetical protein QCI38_08510, partial [Candidatus Thermoplasmatota archaeon]|nr:hypothetical protein [Candidatus Thermoplasmatota archaeon]
EIDNTPPWLVFLTVFDDQMITGDIWLNVTGADDIVDVEFWYYNDTAGWVFIGTATPDGNNWTYLWNTIGIDLEDVTISANATDDAGNVNNIWAENIVIDNTAPSPVFLTPLDDAIIGGIYNVTVYEVDAESMVLSWNNSVTGWNILGNMTYAGADQWYFLWNTATDSPANVEGATLRAEAVDKVGLVGITEAANITLDNVAPTITVTNLQNWDNITGVFQINYTTSPDAVKVSFEWALNVEQVYTFIGESAPTGTFLWDTPYLGDVAVDLMCIVEDAAGNSWFYIIPNIIVDNVPPTAVFIMPFDGSFISGVVNVTMESDPDTVSVFVQYFHSSIGSWQNIGWAIYNETTGYWHIDWNTAAIPAHANLFNARLRANATDDVGLWAFGTVLNVTIDNIAPSNSNRIVNDGLNSFTPNSPPDTPGWLRGTPVDVQVTITETGSGIASVTLYYTMDNTTPTLDSPSIVMTYKSGLGPFIYNCTIPPAPHLSTVKFFIRSVD